jgi:hypothetical protein
MCSHYKELAIFVVVQLLKFSPMGSFEFQKLLLLLLLLLSIFTLILFSFSFLLHSLLIFCLRNYFSHIHLARLFLIFYNYFYFLKTAHDFNIKNFSKTILTYYQFHYQSNIPIY